MTSAAAIAFVLLLAVSGQCELPKLSLRLPNLDARVVGGQNAYPGQFPYQVSLQWGIPPILPTKHFCGGSILSERWIMTAAHCINAVPNIGSFFVRAGKHNITQAKEDGEQIVRVKRSFVHENYTGQVAPYDIALIYLEQDLIFNEIVSKVDLPKPDELHIGNSILSGWGAVSSTSRRVMPEILQFANLPLINLTRCYSAIESITGPSPLHDTNVCTGPLTGGYGACNGDSGGPLVTKENERTIIVGIVSWGINPCGYIGAPSVYTRTSAFINWMEEIMQNYS